MNRLGRLGLVLVACLAVLAMALGAAGCSTTDEDQEEADTTEAATATSSTPAGADPDQPLTPAEEQGRKLFVSGCGSCHTLEAAGTTGQVGPNLDEIDPDLQRVLKAIDVGGTGSGTMPAGIYQGEQAELVARFVSENDAAGD